MKTKLLLLYTSILLTLSSCHTETEDFISKYCPGSCTVIKGRLTTDDRSKPLGGVMLEVRYEEFSMFSSFKRRKAVATTDANGNFELRFLMRDDEIGNADGSFGEMNVYAHLDTSKYLTCSGSQRLLAYYRLKRDTTLAVNYNIPRKAFVQVQALNTAAMQTGDNLTTDFIVDAGAADDPSTCVPGIFWHRNVTAQTFAIAANQQVTIRTYKRKSGVETVTSETVTLTPGQTINYQVTF
ncbi:hypothetical protein [Pontibacter fetidus]|uniref:Carboxypeptidase regulatory-like domain-containing protein n=1 Tax=Pontibacter fetidus TaxID=2700082 RepID=A0A6B2GYZ2_9BACT|nr:hypothetical protein [Pontibacter fetidus]NDK55263.1 hypothetical protein [Pontibacter fetidus]